MSNAWRILACTVIALIVSASPLLATKVAAEAIRLGDALSSYDVKCLSELLLAHYDYPGYHSAEIAELSRSAKVGRAALSKRKHKAYIFLFENIGWCGSAGCLLIIGEKRKGGYCHLLYVSDGTKNAIEIRRRRDYGYRRLYTPCEARFNGSQYQQVHEDCPTLDIQR